MHLPHKLQTLLILVLQVLFSDLCCLIKPTLQLVNQRLHALQLLHMLLHQLILTQ